VRLTVLCQNERVDFPHGPLEHFELRERIVPDQRLGDEQSAVHGNGLDQLGQRRHEGGVVLHPSGRVHENHVVLGLGGLIGVREGGRGHAGGILRVPLREDVALQAPGVRLELLYGPAPEGVSRHEQNPAAVGLEVVGKLGNRGGFPNSVNTFTKPSEKNFR
jgi:hypothetical protein